MIHLSINLSAPFVAGVVSTGIALVILENLLVMMRTNRF